MKKIIVFALITVLTCSMLLVACTTTKPESTPAPTTTPTSAPDTKGNEPVELNFAFHMPAMSGVARIMLIPFATDLEAATNGRVKLVQHPGGSLVGSAQAYDALLSGMCDIALVSPGENPGRFPRSDIMNLPLIFPNSEVASIAYHEYLNKYAVDTELKDVMLMTTVPMHPQQYIGNKEVQKLEDFKGIKMRGGGKYDTAIMNALGADGVVLPTSEAYSAIDTGLVDGTLFAFEGALAMGYDKITKYRTQCDIFLSVFQILMNKQSFDRLPADIQQIFIDFSTPENSRKYGAAWSAEAEGAKKALEGKDKAAGNPPIYVISSEERARWGGATQPVTNTWIKDMDALKLPGQTMYDDIKSIVKKYSQ